MILVPNFELLLYPKDLNLYFKYQISCYHYHLIKYPKSITVKNEYGPYVIPATSSNGEKYVKSAPNSTTRDNLLYLPREE